MRRLIAVLMFLMLVNEGATTGTEYARDMFAPFYWVDQLLFDTLPIKIRPFDLLLAIAAVASPGIRPGVRPMRSALLLALCTTTFWLLLGLVRGGDMLMGSRQVYLMLTMLLATVAIARTHQKAAHYRTLAKVVVAAAFYRAVMCVLFYLNHVRDSGLEPPPHFTTHCDSVLWVVAITMLIANVLENRSGVSKLLVFLGTPLMMFAIHLNNRRLAWVSLAGSLIALYFMLPASPAKMRLKRVATVVVPIIGLYVAVGWGRREAIFKPVAAISSVSEASDNSTKSRNNENLSLIATGSYRPFTGTGWGHKFVLLSHTYIANTTELWPYIPHNSVLGLFAFTGIFGVAGFWLMFPVAVFFHARAARVAKEASLRTVSVLGVVVIVVGLNQLFGDMGIFSRPTMYMLSLSLAVALRVPVEAGAWQSGKALAVRPAAGHGPPEIQPSGA